MAAQVKQITVQDPDACDSPCIFTVATVEELHSHVTRVFRQPGFLSFFTESGGREVITPSFPFKDLPNKLLWTHRQQGPSRVSAAAAPAGSTGMAGNVQVAGLRELMTERDINFKDDDLRRLLQHGYYNARLLGAATVERLVDPVGLKLGLACLLVKEFGASPPQGARAGAGARAAGDYYSLMELLEEIPPECKCTATSSASHTPDVTLPIGFKMKLWDEFREEVMNDIYAEDLHALLESRRVLRHPRLPTPLGAEEAHSNSAFADHVTTPVNRVLLDLSHELQFQLGCTAGTAEQNRKPDFALYDTHGRSTGEITLLACGDGRAATVLQDIACIVHAYDHGVPKIRQQVVPQIYSYSGQQRLRYAWLTTYERLWVIKMEHEQIMLASPPLHRTSQNPSLRQVMLWLALKAMGPDGKMPGRQPCSQVPISGQPGRGTQGSETRPSLSGGPAQNTRSRAGGQAPAPAAQPAPQPAPQGLRRSKEGNNEGKKEGKEEKKAVHSITPVEAFGPLTVLGYGESGTVNAGRLNGQDVAIKSADCFNSQDVVQRLQHEGEVYGMLRHLQGTCLPHLEGFGLTEYGAIYFLATRLIRGSHCKEGSVVSRGQRRGAEKALAAIHQAGFLHGDIRPENLIFEEATGRAAFLDLGFSRACTSAEKHEDELQQLRTMLTPRPTRVHGRSRSQRHSSDGAGAGDD